MWTRLRAGLIHLGISLFVMVGVLAFVMTVWYPGGYFDAVGPGPVLFLLVLVDLCLGPLITVIIYDPKKRSLRSDLAIVAIIQMSAFLYGVNVIFDGRPAFLVFNVDRFTIVAASEISEQELRAAVIKTLPLNGPKLVGVRAPADKGERERILFSSVQGGGDLPQMPRYYVPYESMQSDVKAGMLSLSAVMGQRSQLSKNEIKALVDACLIKNNLRLEDVGFAPVQARKKDLLAVLRRSDASIIDMLSIDPWGQ